MIKKKSLVSRSIWLIVVTGMFTGMGNGSVFGAAMMCLLGRGQFYDWGGIGVASYFPNTFDGFMNWAMIVFGLAYIGILVVGLNRHDALENAAGQ
jgi:hypothetical protein